MTDRPCTECGDRPSLPGDIVCAECAPPPTVPLPTPMDAYRKARLALYEGMESGTSYEECVRLIDEFEAAIRDCKIAISSEPRRRSPRRLETINIANIDALIQRAVLPAGIDRERLIESLWALKRECVTAQISQQSHNVAANAEIKRLRAVEAEYAAALILGYRSVGRFRPWPEQHQAALIVYQDAFGVQPEDNTKGTVMTDTNHQLPVCPTVEELLLERAEQAEALAEQLKTELHDIDLRLANRGVFDGAPSRAAKLQALFATAQTNDPRGDLGKALIEIERLKQAVKIATTEGA